MEAQLGPETDRRVASMLGGMGNTGSSLMGLVPDHGPYLIRATCSPSPGPAAKLTVSQGGVQFLDLEVPCGDPFESTVQLTAGRVTATLSPTSGGESVAALRIERAPAEPPASPTPAAPASSSP
ncbi:hypothetical protein DQ354_15345 [Arthrobacter sp. AQ5-06]|nr:hypothetical protein DQ354_15345 [Arthrobacter sp. AQ5-06]